MKEMSWVYGDGRTGDWMAYLGKSKDGQRLRLEYRFRYYKDDLAFDSKDVKNWYEGEMGDASAQSLERAVATINKIVELCKIQYGPAPECDFVLLECTPDDPKLLFELASRSWANVKVMDKEQAIAAGYGHLFEQEGKS